MLMGFVQSKAMTLAWINGRGRTIVVIKIILAIIKVGPCMRP